MNFQHPPPAPVDDSSSESDEETEVVEGPLRGGEFVAQISAEYSENMIGTDVVFRVGDVEIGCHKFMLAARSKVFSAMFSHQMKENLTNIIELPEMELSTVSTLVKFIYTDKVEEGEITLELLALSDQYDIEELKQQCSTTLSYQVAD